MQSAHNHIIQDFNTAFDEDICLSTLLGQVKAVSMLEASISQHYWDISEGICRYLPPILLCGKHSKHTVARAAANTIGCLEFIELSSLLVGAGATLTNCFECENDAFKAYHLSDIDRLPVYWTNQLFDLIQKRIITIFDPFDPQNPKVKECRGLIILSCSDITKVNPVIVKKLKPVIHLLDYTEGDIKQILAQRIRFYKLQFNENDEPDLLNIVPKLVAGNVELAIEILDWAYRSARSDGQYTIATHNLNRSLHFLNR